MRTLGIDLAAQAEKTAYCVLEWADGSAIISDLVLGATDEAIVRLARSCDVIGIDAPFGWPVPFTEFVGAVSAGSGNYPAWSTTHRDTLRFRLTDYRVREIAGRWPLSVSSDLIAVAAMRCVGLLHALEVTDRSGDGRVFEVYPAVALTTWGFANRGYKTRGSGGAVSRQTLAAILASLRDICPWLTMTADAQSLCARSDDAFDALICALIARAARIGLTLRPAPDAVDRARTEGWIAIPTSGSLSQLTVR